MNSDIPAISMTAALAKFRERPFAAILMIKGDPVNVDSIVGYLDRYGFHVRTRSSLQDGLRDLAARAPDLVILDLYSAGPKGWRRCARSGRSPTCR